MVTGTIGLSRRTLRTIGLQLGRCTLLPSSAPLPFNRLFRQTAAVSHLRPRITRQGSNGILTVSAIAITFRIMLRTRLTLNRLVTFRIMLRTRLTLNRLALFRKPWSCGGGASHPPYRYLYLHLLFHTLQNGSRHAFDAEWNAPLPIHKVSHGFGNWFYTRLLSTPSSSTSELLRTLCLD